MVHPIRLVVTLLIGLITLPLSVSHGQATESKNAAETKNVLFLAGRPSHGYGAHEHYAGCQLLAKSLESSVENLKTEVIRTDWPSDEVLSTADVVVMYSDGGGGHPVNKHLDQIDELAKQGVGIVCIHYAVEVPKGPAGDKFLDWIGGYFETHWSVNPHWRADFTELPEHAITNGVKPFSSQDEWYYHMRFPEDMKGVTPILSAIPPASTLSRPDGPHSGNPHVRAKAGQPQHVAWATEREDGGRGFGFTGGHFHWNWGNDDYRRLMLNAIVWTAKMDVPENGVPIEKVNLAKLKENQDFDPPKKFDPDRVKEIHGIEGE